MILCQSKKKSVNKQVNAIKICSFTIFLQFFDFLRSSSQSLIPQFFVSQIFTVACPEFNLGTPRAQSVSVGKSAGGLIWGSPSRYRAEPCWWTGAKSSENFDNLLVKIKFLKLDVPFYET